MITSQTNKTYKYYIATIKCVKYVPDKYDKEGNQKSAFMKQQYLVNSTSISNAEKTLQGLLMAVYQTFEIISIKESNICGIVNQVQNIFKRSQEQ